VTSGWPTFWTRAWASFPAFVVCGRPPISHSPVSSASRSPTRSSIGRMRRALGGAGSDFFVGRGLAVLVEPARSPNLTPQRERLPELNADLSPLLRAPARDAAYAQDAVYAEPRVPEASVGVVHSLRQDVRRDRLSVYSL
jgi:hypothetical protein